MKRIYLTLMCMACLSMLTGCGDKKADKGAEGESTEVADNQTEGQDATEQGGDEAGSETWGDPAKAAPLDLAALYSSGDFKPASTIIFVDTLAGEKKGEVPTKWEVTKGSAEVAEANGSSYITLLSGDVEMKPKVNGNTNNYLPDSYTMEFQFMFGQDVFYYVRFYNAEDEEFTTRLLLKVEKVVTTDAKAYFYRQHDSSATHDDNRVEKRLQDTLRVILRLHGDLDRLPKNEQAALQRRVAQLTMDYLYNIIMLTHSRQQLDTAIADLQSEGLFPLPKKNYSTKYKWFRRIVGTSVGRTFLLNILPHFKRES